ncbi:MAG TPA: hypothetical protein VE954_42740 [Oligoflexus sp.]|uniref:hypothetical protein n=1 Tax=Oligoflexus sp. TaxID=1971216 RepID=UPI002D6BF171|nr:hypothetical protein [Oligoflexus sp.]HYX39860.1 hypothetical protein [Oligoflexus sp.]
MAFKFSRLTLIPIGIFLSLPSCGEKTAENEGFIPKLSEITKEDVVTEAAVTGDSLWNAVTTLLEIPGLEGTQADVITSLGTPSTLITDTTKATAAANAKIGAVVATATEQQCDAGAATGPFLTDLTATIAAGISQKYSITIATGGFKIDSTTGAPTNLGGQTTLTTKVYLMSYKLKNDTDFRYAFLSVPQATPLAQTLAVKTEAAGTTYGFPLALYAHASTSGLSYGEIAKVAGDLQLGHILLAPAFPGEKICISPDANNACTDDIGKTSVGTSKPYQNDVTDLLGAYECVRTKLTTYAATAGASGSFSTTAGGTVAISNYAKISTDMLNSATYGATLAGASLQPLTYTIGLGRGANVIALAQQRAGAINSVLSSAGTDTATTTAKAALTAAGIVAPQTFSCAVSAGGNFTLAHGKNKVYLNYWVAGYSDFIPAASQTALEAIPGFKEIHATIATIRDDAAKDEATKAAEIAAYVKAIDSSFLMSLYHGSVANWGKMYRAKYYAGAAAALAAGGNAAGAAAAASTATKTLAAAQGANLVMNGTKDKVADLSNSLIFTGVGAGVTAAIATEKGTTGSTSPLAALGGVNWLSLGINQDGSDNGHVSDVTFLTGKSISKTLTKITSTVDEAAYLDKMPSEIISAWLTSECKGKSILSDASN